MSKYVMLADFGSTYSKFNLVDLNQSSFVGQVIIPTSQESTIMNCYQEGKSHLLQSVAFDSQSDSLEELFCSSAWGGFKMVVIGFTDGLTRKAAEYAALGSGTRIVKDYFYHLSDEDVQEIQSLHPDAVLLTGGSDGGNQAFVLDVAEKLAKYVHGIDIIYAGNQAVKDQIREILSKTDCPLHLAENVMPVVNDINVESVRAIAREIFMDKILNTNGLSEVSVFSQLPIIPTPTAVLNATALQGQADGNSVLVVDVGGATTDVHSFGKGLPQSANVHYEGLLEPELKRSVEGDLGMRESSLSVVEQMGWETTLKQLSATWTIEQLESAIETRLNNHKYIPENVTEHQLDQTLAVYAVHKAVERHVGQISKIDNLSYRQIGKDLRQCPKVIATGGVLIHADDPGHLLQEAFDFDTNTLNPKTADFYLDQDYLLSAIGLLGQVYPEFAQTLLKKNLQLLS